MISDPPLTALPHRFFVIDDVVVDPERNLLLREGELIRLEPKVMALLVYLAANSGRVVGKDELLARVWGGVHVVDEALQRAVSLLRGALGDDAKRPRLIETVPTKGYRLLAEPHPLERPVAPSGGTRPGSRVLGLIIAALLAGLIAGALAMNAARPRPYEYPTPAPTPPAAAPVAQPGPPGETPAAEAPEARRAPAPPAP